MTEIKKRLDEVAANITAALEAIAAKGVTVPADANSDNLAELIATIFTGVELNFRVIGGNSQPSNPETNDVWVNTSISITNWVFSATQPSGPTDGTVWFSTGTSSGVAFNALKKNTIQIYPVLAKQYVSGAWVDVPAKSYQNGAWVDWRIGFVFKDGKYGEISGFTCVRSTLALNGEILTLTSSGNVYSHAYSNEKIDLTGIDSIVVTVESGSQGYTAFFGVIDTVPDQNTNTGVIYDIDAEATIYGEGAMGSFSGTFSLNVANLSGEYYLVFNFAGTRSGNGILKISSIDYS